MGKQQLMLKIIITVLILLLIPSLTLAQKQIKLLSVEETPDGNQGGVANLYLRTVAGAGNIYSDTFPLTKLDTQISARFARDIACDFIEKECNDLDFYRNNYLYSYEQS